MATLIQSLDPENQHVFCQAFWSVKRRVVQAAGKSMFSPHHKLWAAPASRQATTILGEQLLS